MQITINSHLDVYARVKNTDLSREDIILTLEYENLVALGEGSANALLPEAHIHFHTRYGQDGVSSREFYSKVEPSHG